VAAADWTADGAEEVAWRERTWAREGRRAGQESRGRRSEMERLRRVAAASSWMGWEGE